jgi:Protein of unknown function (DUF2029).
VSTGNPYAYSGDNGADAYRYAPWFAAVWVPLLGIPRDALMVAWVLVLLGATAVLMVGIVREHGTRGVPLALLTGSLLVSSTAGGNLQPLLIAGLYFGLHGRAGPLAVGLAASVKLVPIFYVIPWIGRGEWRKTFTAIAVAGVLLAPTFLFTIPPVVTDPGANPYPWIALWAVLAGGSTLVAVIMSRSRYGWLAAGTAALLFIPRLLPVDFSIIVPAAHARR